jgi:regulator of replication initiation timing
MERRLKVDARMAVISVPRELRERLGDPASDSLVEMLRQIGAEQRDDVITMVEERFALRLAETRDDLRSEMHAGFLNLQEQIGSVRAEIGSVRAELHKEISHVQEKIGEVHQKIAGQTRWLVTAILAATVLIPIMQKVLATLFPG